MPNIYRKIINLSINGWSWLLDYLYVAYWQIHDFFIHENAAQYLTPASKLTETPIILIPGIYENWQFMKPVAEVLYKAGHPIYIIDDLNFNTGDIEKMSELVDAFLNKSHITDCIIVAHSKGGLIGKYILANLNTHRKVKGMVALNTPFSGSLYAYLMPLKSTSIFKPNSPILGQLAANTEINKTIVSIYGLFDPHIPKGSFLQGAQNLRLSTRGHFRIMNNSSVHNAVLTAIKNMKERQL
ncbi:MAG: alpha/beta hydrolase [Candidatus Saccharibacteria bacterium]|nr:alpha/beta hydrolase [Candidatus Saccharibacteria bacterium]